MSAIDAVRTWTAVALARSWPSMLVAASLPMIPDGMPVRGGDGVMTVPLGDFRGREI